MNAVNRLPPFSRRPVAQAVLAAIVVAALPGAAYPEAAKVTFARGPVAAEDADGIARRLVRGSEIEAGDTIHTRSGHVQLRFTDGAYVSLKPGTDFRVDQYQYRGGSGDTEERGFFSLLRGGLRTITGLIGRARKASYRMTTPVATIGIRGTGYSLDLHDNANGVQELKWNVADGTIAVQLADGTWLTFAQGGAGTATREQFEQLLFALQQLADQGRIEVTREELLDIIAAGNNVDTQGLSSLLSTPSTLAPPPDCASASPGCAMTAAIQFGSSGGVVIDGGEGNLAAVFGASSALQSFEVAAPATSHRLELVTADGSEGYFTDSNVGTASAVLDGSAYYSVDPANPHDPAATATWTRWIAPGTTTGDPLVSGNFSGNDTFASVITIPPPITPNAGMGTYSLNGFSPPAMSAGAAAALGAVGVPTGTLTAYFGSGYVTVDMTIPFANDSYHVTDSDGLLMHSYSAFQGTGTPFYKGQLDVSGGGRGVACQSSCYGYGAGNVFGPNVDGATLGYQIRDSGLDSDVSGVTVFKRTSLDPGGPS